MSYILDSLKKLEKEKSEFENKLNLKEMIVKDDFGADKAKLSLLKKRNFLLTFLAFTSVLFVFMNYQRFNYSNTTLMPKPGDVILKEKKTPKPKIQTLQSLKLSPVNKPDLLSPTHTLTAPENKTELLSEKPGKEESMDNDAESLPVSYDFSDNELDERLDHIEQMIQQKYIPKTIEKLMEGGEKIEEPINSLLTKPLQQVVSDKNIPEIKVKGIIFFGQNNLLNYVLMDYKGESQIKLKTGDILEDIEVLEIQPDKVILIYQGELVEKRMGS